MLNYCSHTYLTHTSDKIIHNDHTMSKDKHVFVEYTIPENRHYFQNHFFSQNKWQKKSIESLFWIIVAKMSHSFTNSMNNRNTLLSNSGLNVENLRNIRNECISGQQYRSAVFWSDKIVSLSSGQTDDVYEESICFFHVNEFHRAIHCIKSRDLHKTVLSCRHLAAKCHVR